MGNLLDYYLQFGRGKYTKTHSENSIKIKESEKFGGGNEKTI
jgi:hypothetical protein